jgi:hypothetical protein
MSSQLRWSASLAHVFLLMYGAAAVGQTPPAGSVVSPPPLRAVGSCPSSEAVWASIATLVPGGTLEALPGAATIDLADLGDNYRVTVTKGEDARERIYRDAARDCGLRARFAAVFIVLTLMPPELMVEPPIKPPSVASVPVAPAVPPVETPLPRFRFELGAFWDAAPAVFAAPSMASPGGELRSALGRRRLRVVVGVGAQTRARFNLGGLEAREERASLDIGLRAVRAFGRLDLGGEASVVSAIFRAQGTNTAGPERQTRLDLGARVGLVVRVGAPRTRLAPFAGVHATFFPSPYDIAARPQGVLGHTPSLWLGATVGVCALP